MEPRRKYWTQASAWATTVGKAQYARGMLKAAEAFKEDTGREDRLAEVMCAACWYFRVNGQVAGAAMTSYSCALCGEERHWGSTNTPVICSGCATAHALCVQCGGDIHLNAARTDWPVPRVHQASQVHQG